MRTDDQEIVELRENRKPRGKTLCVAIGVSFYYHDLVNICHVIDIDECANPSACGSNAVCTNQLGNYTCTCPEGYIGNPYTGVS